MTKKEFAIAQMEKWPMTRDGEAFDATIRINRYDAAIAAWDKCIDVEVIPLLEHFIFLLNAAENLYRPDKPLRKKRKGVRVTREQLEKAWDRVKSNLVWTADGFDSLCKELGL